MRPASGLTSPLRGLPDPHWGEVGCAVAVPCPGAQFTLEQIHAHCAGHLSKYKWPARLRPAAHAHWQGAEAPAAARSSILACLMTATRSPRSRCANDRLVGGPRRTWTAPTGAWPSRIQFGQICKVAASRIAALTNSSRGRPPSELTHTVAIRASPPATPALRIVSLDAAPAPHASSSRSTSSP